MAYVRKKNQFSKSQFKSRIGIDALVRDVKIFEFKKTKNWIQAKNISDQIAMEWLALSNSYAKKLDHRKLNSYLTAEYEAQQQIIFCLLGLLNEKILDFFDNTLADG